MQPHINNKWTVTDQPIVPSQVQKSSGMYRMISFNGSLLMNQLIQKACTDTLDIFFNGAVIKALEQETIPDWVYAPLSNLSYSRDPQRIKTQFWPTINQLIICVASHEELRAIISTSMKLIIQDPQTSQVERETMDLILQLILNPDRAKGDDQSLLTDLIIGLSTGLTTVGSVLLVMVRMGYFTVQAAAQAVPAIAGMEAGIMMVIDNLGSMVIAGVAGEYTMYAMFLFRLGELALFMRYSATVQLTRTFLNMARMVGFAEYIPYYRLGSDIAGLARGMYNRVINISGSGVRRLVELRRANGNRPFKPRNLNCKNCIRTPQKCYGSNTTGNRKQYPSKKFFLRSMRVPRRS